MPRSCPATPLRLLHSQPTAAARDLRVRSSMRDGGHALGCRPVRNVPDWSLRLAASGSTGGRNPRATREFRARKRARRKSGPLYVVGRRESNPRPKALRARRYMLVTLFGLIRRQHNVRGAPPDQPLGFDPRPKGAGADDPVIVTLHPRARAQVGSGLGLKRPERRRRRSRLVFCHRINEEDDALGMLPATSRPPSKPGRPRGRPMVVAIVAKIKSRRQASRFLARIARCFSRCQSRSRSLSRLSCSCLPRATPRSSLTWLFFQYMASGTRV